MLSPFACYPILWTEHVSVCLLPNTNGVHVSLVVVRSHLHDMFIQQFKNKFNTNLTKSASVDNANVSFPRLHDTPTIHNVNLNPVVLHNSLRNKIRFHPVKRISNNNGRCTLDLL